MLLRNLFAAVAGSLATLPAQALGQAPAVDSSFPRREPN
jgi:hypothetical protein